MPTSRDPAAPPEERGYELTLFVSGASEHSARAIATARQLCDTYLDRPYHLSVVDVHDDHPAVVSGRVLATPTLLKSRPQPVRQYVGDLSRTDEVLVTLALPSPDDAPVAPT